MRKFTGGVLAIVMLLTASAAQADMITTLFARNNGGSLGGAVYFDVTVGADPLTVTGFDTNTAETVPFGFSIYLTAPGSSAFGNETNGGAWNLVATGSGVGQGIDNPSNVVLNNFFNLAANTSYGMALVMSADAGHDYTNGDGNNENYSNANIALSLGSATNVPFTGNVFSPRVWNGTMYYNVIPEPASAVFGGVALIGLVLVRRRR